MKNFLSMVFFLLLALPLLLLEAAFDAAYRLWETWLRAARELRDAPPAGGMYGTMARRLRERSASARLIETRTRPTEEKND